MHQYVKAALLFRGHRIPWGIHLYVKKKHVRELKVAFKKTTEMAADLKKFRDGNSVVKNSTDCSWLPKTQST